MKLNVRFRDPNDRLHIAFRDPNKAFGVFFKNLQTMTENDYDKLINKPSINSIVLEGDVSLEELGIRKVLYGTTSYWNAHVSLVGEQGCIYIYSDVDSVVSGGKVVNVPGFKVGDGETLLSTTPFTNAILSSGLSRHIANNHIHITDAEREYWNDKDYENLSNKPTINSVTISGNVSLADLGLHGIYYDTKANWDQQVSLVGEEGSIYVYKDAEVIYDEVGNPTFIAGIKVGDGNAYLIDMPFVSADMSAALLRHISDQHVHLTDAERQFWNNKVSAYTDPLNEENLIFSTTHYELDGVILSND